MPRFTLIRFDRYEAAKSEVIYHNTYETNLGLAFKEALIELLDNESNKMFKKVKLLGVDPYFVNNVPYKELLEEDLNIFNIIPGVYMKHGYPDKHNIKIYISYYNQVYIVHEQYLSRIVKLYKMAKN